MLDNGTVALHRYLQRYQNELSGFNYDSYFKNANTLCIKCEQLFELLEEVYYLMGEEVYDTYTQKQYDDPGNIYFEKKEKGQLIAHTFPKMNTYGLTELLTNNAQGTTRKDSNTQKIANIEKADPVLASQIKTAFDKRGIKLLSKVYFEEPYTKITRLEKPEKAHFTEGKYQCAFTGMSVKKAVDAQNTSAFISGILSFSSYLSTSDKKISWLAMYLSRFAAANALYVYENKLRERLMVYLFHANNLRDLAQLWASKRIEPLDLDTLRIKEFVRNFEVQPMLSSTLKGDSQLYDLQLTNDNLLAILYTLNRRALAQPKVIADDPLSEDIEMLPAYSLMSIRADAYAATMRPNRTEIIDNINPLIQFISNVEEEGLSWKVILDSLKIIKPSLATNQKASRLEREVRETVLGKIFKIQPIHKDMADFFVDCLTYLLEGETTYRNYNQLLKFTKFYEDKKSNNMEEQTAQRREAAIALGQSIGISIINWTRKEGENPDKKSNAKQGRKYVIRLRKARNFSQFRDAVISLQSRFQFGIGLDNRLDSLTDETYKEYRDFAIISATNILISTYNTKNEQQNEQA